MILFSDRGTPDGYRFMNGYGSHTFSMINSANERVWVKFHFKTLQGNKTFTGAQADELKKDPDYAQRDLVQAINKGDFPKWGLKIQVMTEDQAKAFQWNPFDVTKVWSHSECNYSHQPQQRAGSLMLRYSLAPPSGPGSKCPLFRLYLADNSASALRCRR